MAAILARAAPGSVQAASPDWIGEGKIGVLAHDVGFLGHHVEDDTHINGELLLVSPGFLS